MRRIVPLSRINKSLSPEWMLDEAAIEKRRAQYGTNDIANIQTTSWLHLVTNTMKDPMIWFLIITSILFALLKNYQEATILMLAIIPLIGIDTFLHWRTQVSTASLDSRLATSATVIRNAAKSTIPAREIVPGDLVIVAAGSIFPADGLVIAGKNIQVEESSLTGESLPVFKKILHAWPYEAEEMAIEDDYWGFAGTRLLTGEATVRVVYTGSESLYGQIINSTRETAKAKTPLQLAIAKLVFLLIITACLLCISLAVVRYYQGFGLIDALLSAAVLAIAALPDEFPVVFTFFLGVGVYRLARKKALVRRAASIENLGRITHICSDKTGTITDGRLRVATCISAVGIDEKTILYLAALASRTESADLLDMAILDEALKKKIILEERAYSYPFTEDRKRETAVIDRDSKWLIVTKGAPETILAITTLTPEEKEDWQQKISTLASQTYKVLACARITKNKAKQMAEPTQDYEFIGLIAFTDPVRPGVKEAIKSCQDAQIHVLMITGDHPATAYAIAKKIGLGNGNPKVILAEELETYLKNGGEHQFRQIDVIARAVPLQKYEVVKALQAQDAIVAVTGDGVNDVPALKAADIGIAMGERGTESAREVADIVLLDDNFESIANAIGEGRQLFKNLKTCFKYLLMIHFPFVLSAAFVPLLGYPLLYYPIDVVFIELIIHPTALLVFQDLPKNKRLEKAGSFRKSNFFTSSDVLAIILLGLVTTAFISLSFIFTLKIGAGIEHARTLALVMLSFISVAITMGLSDLKTAASRVIIFIIVCLTILLVRLPLTATWFNFSPLTMQDWGIVLLIAMITWFLTKKV